MAEDRLAHLQRLNADSDIRIERRHLSPADFGRFIDATRGKGERYGLTGEQRVLLYITAAYTGLRASELASLTPASFDLTADPPMVTVEAGYSKHRKRDELPLHPELASRLRWWLTERREAADDRRAIAFHQRPVRRNRGARCGPDDGRWTAGAGGW